MLDVNFYDKGIIDFYLRVSQGCKRQPRFFKVEDTLMRNRDEGRAFNLRRRVEYCV